MRTAPAWIGWAALAAAATGCCRMQPPSAVDSLESTWTRLRDGTGKPAPAPVPVAARTPAPTVPAGPPPDPVSAEGAPTRPSPIPLPVPPARGESPASSPGGVPLPTGSPGAQPYLPGGSVALDVAPAASSGSAADAAPLRVGGSLSSRGVSRDSASLAISSAGAASASAGEDAALRVGPGGVPGASAAAAPLEIGSVSGPEIGSLVRRESFLAPFPRGSGLPSPTVRPLAVPGSELGGASSGSPRVPLAVGAGDSRAPGVAPLPAVPVLPKAEADAPSPPSPMVGKAPGLLDAADGREPAPVVPSRALERAAAQDADREAARRRQDEAALREREAEAGVLRQFLRRVLRLDPPAPAETPVSEPAG